MSGETSDNTLTGFEPKLRDEESAERDCLALVIAWSRMEPDRVGQVALFPARTGTQVLGRGSRSGEGTRRVLFYQHRPGLIEETPELGGQGLSREQLEIRPEGRSSLRVDNIGRPPLLINGTPLRRGVIRPGDLIEIQQQLLLYCTIRPYSLPPFRSFEGDLPPFGAPDEVGMVGESPVVWALRDTVAFLARRDVHVLILGESGTGKELAAQAIHALSRRRDQPLVSRNAATIPPGIADAELFGNVKNYPNPGMLERPGLIGTADGGTLFLDEFGELPVEVQSHLLRVLDGGGEYQRLGDATPRRADIRFIAATNRSQEELKADLVGRLKLRVETPRLQDRREDIPLLVRWILKRIIGKEPDLARFAIGGEPQITPELIQRLLVHEYTLHVRELESLLWLALSTSPSSYVGLTPEVRRELRGQLRTPSAAVTDPDSVTPEQIVQVLDECNGSQEKAWRVLGLSSRHVLYRLIKKFNLNIPQQP